MITSSPAPGGSKAPVALSTLDVSTAPGGSKAPVALSTLDVSTAPMDPIFYKSPELTTMHDGAITSSNFPPSSNPTQICSTRATISSRRLEQPVTSLVLTSPNFEQSKKPRKALKELRFEKGQSSTSCHQELHQIISATSASCTDGSSSQDDDVILRRLTMLKSPDSTPKPDHTETKTDLNPKPTLTTTQRQLKFLDEIMNMEEWQFVRIPASRLNRLTNEQFEQIPASLIAAMREEVIDDLKPGKRIFAQSIYYPVRAQFAMEENMEEIIDENNEENMEEMKRKAHSIAGKAPYMTVPLPAISNTTNSSEQPTSCTICPRNAALEAPLSFPGSNEAPTKPPKPPKKKEEKFRKTSTNWTIVMSNIAHFRRTWKERFGDKVFKILLVTAKELYMRMENQGSEFNAETLKKEVEEEFDESYCFFYPRKDDPRVIPPTKTVKDWRRFVHQNIFDFRKVWSTTLGVRHFSVMINVSHYVMENWSEEVQPFDLDACLIPKV